MNSENTVTIDFLGGAMEVGASCILVELAEHRLLLDCGIRQKAGADPLPDLHRIQERGGIDAIIVSHAHMDHTGSLPVISKAYPLAPIYATAMTIDLTRVLLYDSIRLMNRQEEGIPIYAEQDVEGVFGRMHTVHYEQPLEVLPGITLTMYPAGHIAGAACIYLQSKTGSLFYSGDFCSFAQNTIEGIRLPRLRPDIAIVESTYGDRLHSNRQVEEQRLIETAAECIAKKGKMLIPVFALGRAQEVLLILRRAMNKGEIPKTRIYVDGMVRDMNTAYSRNPYYLKNALARRIEKGNDVFYSDEIVPVDKLANREELLNTSDPVIFVASSGMLTGGPSVEYAKKIAAMENGYLVITGYQDEEAPGRQIMDLLEEAPANVPPAKERALNLGGVRVPLRCTLRKAALSAHGDKSEITALLASLSARNVFLVHGDKDVIQELSRDLGLDYRTRIFTPVCGRSETIFLRSPRQQLKKDFPYTMQKTEVPDGHDQEFYQYLTLHYPDRKFTLPDLAYIWYGRHSLLTEEALEHFSQVMEDSRWFARDARRLFLFICRDAAEIQEENQKAAVMTQQKLRTAAEECFAGFPYRKMGFHNDREEVSFTFDFPREAAERFDEAAAEFFRRTGWTAVRNLEPNEAAIQSLLLQHFDAAVQKISIRKTEEQVLVRLSRQPEAETLRAAKEEFERLTGYFLLFEGVGENPAFPGQFTPSPPPAPNARENDYFLPKGSEKQEQNLAFSLIDLEFDGTSAAPYKKSLMSDQHGKYIQLAFLSPAVGQREADRLQRLADQTGWRVRIAPSVNQNAISGIAVRICQENGVDLKKLPSWQPQQQRLVLRPQHSPSAPEVSEVLERICRLIQEQTGVVCVMQ